MTYSSLKILVEMNGDDCLVNGEIVATITHDDELTQPWVVKINNIEVHRRATWALAYDYVRSHVKYGTLPNPCANQDELVLAEFQQIKLPTVGESYFVGEFLLKCVQVADDFADDYAAVWDVLNDGLIIGEIQMDWDCSWKHTLSFESFATPQKAVLDLCESATVLVEKPELSRKKVGKVAAVLSLVSVVLITLAMPSRANDWCSKAADRREGCPVSINY